MTISIIYNIQTNLWNVQITGSVGITLNHTPGIPKDPKLEADKEAAETYNQFFLGWFANPIFGNGDYPDIMKWQIGNKSLERGLSKSRLPEFTEDEKKLLKGILCTLTTANISRVYSRTFYMKVIDSLLIEIRKSDWQI